MVKKQVTGAKAKILDDPKPKMLTKTDAYGKPVRVMMPRRLPESGYEKGFEQPSYQCKEEELGTKVTVLELQEKYPEKFYAMFSGVTAKKSGVKTYWWKVLGEDALKYKFYYRTKLAPDRPKPVRLTKDKDNFFHVEDGIASINSIDWLREKFKEIGVGSRYLNLFVVEFETRRKFTEAELNNYRNYHGNIAKKFREMNQPKNIDVEYKKALNGLGTEVWAILGRTKTHQEYATGRLDRLYFKVRLFYHNYCNGAMERSVWQEETTMALNEIEVCLQLILEHSQNLDRMILRTQEKILEMRPSLLQKKDVDKLARQMEEAKNKKLIKKPKTEIERG